MSDGKFNERKLQHISQGADDPVMLACQEGRGAGMVQRQGMSARLEPAAREVLPEHDAASALSEKPVERGSGLTGRVGASEKHRVLETAEGQGVSLACQRLGKRQGPPP